MPIIDYIDPVNRDIYLHADTVSMPSLHPIDIYKEMRTLRATNESLRGYDVFLSAFGNVPKGPSKATERFVRCNYGTRIIPYNTSHELTIIGVIITDDGQEGRACFDRSPLSPTVQVDINYEPKQVEIITVNLAGGGEITPQDIANIAAAVWASTNKNVNVATMNNAPVIGRGVDSDKWRGQP